MIYFLMLKTRAFQKINYVYIPIVYGKIFVLHELLFTGSLTFTQSTFYDYLVLFFGSFYLFSKVLFLFYQFSQQCSGRKILFHPIFMSYTQLHLFLIFPNILISLCLVLIFKKCSQHIF